MIKDKSLFLSSTEPLHNSLADKIADLQDTSTDYGTFSIYNIADHHSVEDLSSLLVSIPVHISELGLLALEGEPFTLNRLIALIDATPPHIQTLNLSSNDLLTLLQDEKSAANLAHKLSRFLSLNLADTGINHVGKEILSSFLSKLDIKALTLSNNCKGANLQIDVLTPSPKLEYLDLSKNNLIDQDPASLKTLFTKLSSLNMLDLSSNGFGDSFGAKFTLQHADAFKSLSDAQSVDLSSNSLGSMATNELRSLLSATSSIAYLNLSNNEVGLGTWTDLTTVATMFEGYTATQSLDLSSNKIGAPHGSNTKVLIPFFESLSKVKNLDLSKNSLDEISIDDLNSAISKLNGVSALNLSGNQLVKFIPPLNPHGLQSQADLDGVEWEVDAQGFEIWYDASQHKPLKNLLESVPPSVTHLDLSFNGFSNDVNALIAILSFNFHESFEALIMDCTVEDQDIFDLTDAYTHNHPSKHYEENHTLVIHPISGKTVKASDLQAKLCSFCAEKDASLEGSNQILHSTLNNLVDIPDLVNTDDSEAPQLIASPNSFHSSMHSGSAEFNLDLTIQDLNELPDSTSSVSLSFHHDMSTETIISILSAIPQHADSIHLSQIHLSKHLQETSLSDQLVATLSTFESITFNPGELSKLPSEQQTLLFKAMKAKHLNLAGNFNFESPLSATDFNGFKSTNTLDLSNNHLNHAPLATLEALFESFQNLRSLNLSSNSMACTQISDFYDKKPALPFLEHLDLSGNDLGGHFQYHVESLLLLFSNTKKLTLQKNELGAGTNADLISNCLAKYTELESLDLSENNLGYKETNIVEFFQSLPKIKELILANNRLGDISAKALAASIKELTSVENLNLSNNRLAFSVNAGDYLSENPAGLVLNSIQPSVKHLDLSGNLLFKFPKCYMKSNLLSSIPATVETIVLDCSFVAKPLTTINLFDALPEYLDTSFTGEDKRPRLVIDSVTGKTARLSDLMDTIDQLVKEQESHEANPTLSPSSTADSSKNNWKTQIEGIKTNINSTAKPPSFSFKSKSSTLGTAPVATKALTTAEKYVGGTLPYSPLSSKNALSFAEPKESLENKSISGLVLRETSMQILLHHGLRFGALALTTIAIGILAGALPFTWASPSLSMISTTIIIPVAAAILLEEYFFEKPSNSSSRMSGMKIFFSTLTGISFMLAASIIFGLSPLPLMYQIALKAAICFGGTLSSLFHFTENAQFIKGHAEDFKPSNREVTPDIEDLEIKPTVLFTTQNPCPPLITTHEIASKMTCSV